MCYYGNSIFVVAVCATMATVSLQWPYVLLLQQYLCIGCVCYYGNSVLAVAVCVPLVTVSMQWPYVLHGIQYIQLVLYVDI